MARAGGRTRERRAAHYERAIELFEEAGRNTSRRRASPPGSPRSMWDRGRIEQGLEIMDRSYELLSQEEPDADLAELAAQLGRFLFFAGKHDLAMQRIEAALEIDGGALASGDVLERAQHEGDHPHLTRTPPGGASPCSSTR